MEQTAFIHLISDTSDCIFPNSILFEQTELADCFLEYPRFDDQGRVPFHFETIQEYQADDQELQGALQRGIYQVKRFGSTDLICLTNSDKIVLSDELLPRLVKWYHLSSVHMQGMDRLEGTIQQHFYHPRLRNEIRRQLSPCVPCQLNRRQGQQFGALAPREAISIPWQEVHLDTIGPWKLRVNKIDIEFKALTAIDPVTNLLEIALLNNGFLVIPDLFVVSLIMVRNFERKSLTSSAWMLDCVLALTLLLIRRAMVLSNRCIVPSAWFYGRWFNYTLLKLNAMLRIWQNVLWQPQCMLLDVQRILLWDVIPLAALFFDETCIWTYL